MSRFKHCFAMKNGGYQEIPQHKMGKDGLPSAEYKDRYFIPLHGCLMEVPYEDYKAFYKNRRRQKYIKEESILHRDASYNAMDTDGCNGEEMIADKRNISVEEYVVQSILIDNLNEALELLNAKDAELIQRLFYEGVTEREYAKEKGCSYQSSVHKKKKRIIKFLRKQLGVKH